MIVEYLDLGTVLDRHAERFGPDRVLDRGGVEGILGRCSSGFGEVEFYPSLADKAAVLLHGFASTQYFEDGNKRMGVYTVNALLQINGYELTLSDGDMYGLAMAAASNDADVALISGTIGPHIVPLEGLDVAEEEFTELT